MVSQDVAMDWTDRWDAQQQAYLPDREDRFTAIVDLVEEIAGRADPLVLDLGSGPGSLAGLVGGAAADPALAALHAERARRPVESAHHGSPAGQLSVHVHVHALHAAGFAEIGTIWQRARTGSCAG